jgi:Flp pilus assembly protein TadG
MRGRRTRRGQALVEFALAIIVFLVLVMGIVDFGRGIYTYNGVSQAAREVARTASVHPGDPLGASSAVAATTNTQKALVPGMQNPVFTCMAAGTPPTVKATGCLPGDLVRVEVTAPFTVLTPLLGSLGPFQMKGSSTIEIQ